MKFKAALALLALFCCKGLALTFDAVPGVVIDYIQSPTRIFGYAINPVYISDPSIVVLENGDYIASHARFGSGSGSSTSGLTHVFRSADKGESWQQIAELNGILRASLFVHNGDLYLLGAEAEGKPNVIRKSTDNGNTWTVPVDQNTGLLGSSGLGTPNNPVVANGRIWSGATRRLLSAPVGSDLLKASSWSITNSPSSAGNPFGDDWQDWTEGQVVAAPWSSVYVLPKIRALPYTALIRATSATSISFNASAPNAFPALPGGEKKFGAGRDPVTNKFYVLSNPVLAAHAGGSTPPELVRTAAGILSSKDLVNWDVEKIYLFTANLDTGSFGEGFQYFNFDLDGDDMVIVSRTAFDVGEGQRKPPRGHDSNLMTFHKIQDFRNASPEHILIIEGGNVKRYEITQHQNAPLGNFTLGNTFAGELISQPNGIGQDGNGCVYIREASGRILRFDPLGNFLGLADSSPVTLQTAPLAITQPDYGQRSWSKTGSGDWHELTNWYYWGRADTDYEVANFGSAIDSAAVINIDGGYTLKGLRFRSPNTYTLSGSGNLTVKSDTNLSEISVEQGSHIVSVPITLNSQTIIGIDDGCSLRFTKAFNVNAKQLSIQSEQKVEFEGAFSLNGGSLVLDGQAPISFGAGANATPNGSLIFEPHPSIQLGMHKVIKLFDRAERINGTFTNLTLPALDPSLMWDTSLLYLQGVITVVPDMAKADSLNLSHTAYWWLVEDCRQKPGCLYADLNADGIVDFFDLLLLAEHWLSPLAQG